MIKYFGHLERRDIKNLSPVKSINILEGVVYQCCAFLYLKRPKISTPQSNKSHAGKKERKKKNRRQQQGSNLRGRSPTDFKSVSLTTRTY